MPESNERYEFNVGDKVLVYHNGLLYEAICLDRQKNDNRECQYFIHYKGFKSKWDEWCDEDDILEINQINMNHKKNLESRWKNCKILKRGKKSQEPRTTEDDFSPKPASRKRGRPRKNVDQSAELAVEQSAELVVGQSAEQAVRESAEPVVEQSAKSETENSAEPSVAQSTSLVFEQSPIPIVENKQAVQAVANIALNIIPRSKHLANELQHFELPFNLKKAIEFDRMMMQQPNYACPKMLRFPEKNFLAEVVYTFTNSSYFIDDRLMRESKRFCVTLMQYFNNCVHTFLTYNVEREYRLKAKGLEYFLQRQHYQPEINFIYNELLKPKTIWCYLYGPMHLLRLIVCIPKVLKSISMLPEYDSETFIPHVKELIWFLENNFHTYFTSKDYVQIDAII